MAPVMFVCIIPEDSRIRLLSSLLSLVDNSANQ